MKTFFQFDYNQDVVDLLERKKAKYPEENPYTNIRRNISLWQDKNYDGAGPLVSIIILTKDNLNYLRPCLASIERFTSGIDVEIILISNAQEQATKDYLDNSGYRVYYRDKPFSFAQFNNYGAGLAKGRYLVFLNDDTVVTPKWLESPLRILEEDVTIGVCGVKVLSLNNTLQHMGIAINQPGEFSTIHMFNGESPDIPQANEYRYVRAVSGVCLITTQAIFYEIGGFEDSFLGGYYEDLDLCLRVERDTETKVLYVPDSVIYHFGGVTFNKLLNKTQIFHTAMKNFHSRWEEDVENTSYRFKSPGYLYGGQNKKMIIRNSYLSTAGGGEQLTLSLARVFRDEYRVEVQSAVLNEQVVTNLRSLLGTDLKGINFDLLNPQAACDVFINAEFGSFYAGQPAERSIYYAMFPQACGDSNTFLASYDQSVGISKYASDYIWHYWRRRAPVIYPAVEQIGMVKDVPKEKIILSVGRFFTTGHKKNQDVLLRAFQALHLDGWKLVFVGSHHGSPDDLQYINDIQKNIKIWGLNAEVHLNLPRTALLDWYRKAAVYWHGAGFGAKDPIQREHFGISIVEAMSAGCIPVVFGEGGPTEVVGDVGVPYMWKDLRELQEKTRAAIGLLGADNELDVRNACMEQADVFNTKHFVESWRKFIYTHIVV